MAPRRVSDTFGGYRVRLVEALRAKGIHDIAVLAAFGEVPRHLFVPEALRSQAYEDTSLPIGCGQTISQPSTQAAFLEALELTGSEVVLEVGTGSGYQTALLAYLADRVMSIERFPDLAEAARRSLDAAGCSNTTVTVGDGTLGWLPLAPYDAILVAAVGPSVPGPLIKQLAEGGRLVMPVERAGRQCVVRIVKHDGKTKEETMGGAQFVPLVGRHGFSEGG